MKHALLIPIALLAIALGCKATETLSSGGEGEANEPDVSIKVDAGIATDPPVVTGTGKQQESGTEAPAPQVKEDAGEIATATKEPPKGEAADNPKVTEKSLLGNYDGEVIIPPQAIEMMKNMVPPEDQGKIEQEIKDAEITLELVSGGKYKMTTKAKGRTEVKDGTWSYDPATGIVTLTAPKMTEADVAQAKQMGATDAQIAAGQKQTMACRVSEDGKILEFTQTQMGMTFGMTFTKK